MGKASLKDEAGKELTFRFNPKEYSISKSATWNRPTTKGAKRATKPEFGGVQPRSLQMELFFDDWEGRKDLVKDIETLLGWLQPTEKTINTKKPQPHLLTFKWGSKQGPFKGFLKSVSAKYTMFDSDGGPVRATAQITLEEVAIEAAGQNPTSGSAGSRRTHLVAAGDSLHSIAYAEYDDPNLWRGLAAYNGIDDPLRVTPGSRLLIPSADEAAGLS
jgi:nucleoid-associated protein YgaU